MSSSSPTRGQFGSMFSRRTETTSTTAPSYRWQRTRFRALRSMQRTPRRRQGRLTNRSLVPGNLASIFGSVISDTDINVASPSSESTAVGASRQAVAEAISDNGRRAHTTANPADIDGVADPGSGAAVNHPNHVHRLQTDETLEFSAGGNLGVSITDVVEHLQQRIQYYTNDNDHSTDGSAAGMVYETHQITRRISPRSRRKSGLRQVRFTRRASTPSRLATRLFLSWGSLPIPTKFRPTPPAS